MSLGVLLWLCPKPSELHDKLTTLMSLLNTLFPGQPPRFEPHITITSNIKVSSDHPHDEVDRILSAGYAAFSSIPKTDTPLVVLGEVKSQRKYFKKLYFQVDRHPNLVSLTQIIRELFVMLPEQLLAHPAEDPQTVQQRAADLAAVWAAEYDPHLSLVYSDIHPIDSALWRTIKTRVQDYLGEVQWDGGVLKLVLTEGPVEEWVELGSVSL